MKAANRASEVYLLDCNELKWKTDPRSALQRFACGLRARQITQQSQKEKKKQKTRHTGLDGITVMRSSLYEQSVFE